MANDGQLIAAIRRGLKIDHLYRIFVNSGVPMPDSNLDIRMLMADGTKL